jgi:hypothetical protein
MRDGVTGPRNEEEEEEEEEEEAALRDALQDAVNMSMKAVRKKGEEEKVRMLTAVTAAGARVTAEAEAEAAKLTAVAKAQAKATRASAVEFTAGAKASAAKLMAEAEAKAKATGAAAAKVTAEAAKMKRVVEEDRAGLKAEIESMEGAHVFENSAVLLDVGGHKFTTSRLTLTSVADTMLASKFSGRYPLTLNAEGAYFIDRDGRHFHHILNFLRDSGSFELSSDLTEGQIKELAKELEYYGLLDRAMPYHAQKQVGRALLQSACLDGTKRVLKTALAQARALVFKTKTSFLKKKYQALRWVVTDRVKNGSPVWTAPVEGGELFMYRSTRKRMTVGSESQYAAGCAFGDIFNDEKTDEVATPTDLPSDMWTSNARVTLPAQYALAEMLISHSSRSCDFACVPKMYITTVYGLDDGEPAMAAALRQLAALNRSRPK